MTDPEQVRPSAWKSRRPSSSRRSGIRCGTGCCSRSGRRRRRSASWRSTLDTAQGQHRPPPRRTAGRGHGEGDRDPAGPGWHRAVLPAQCPDLRLRRRRREGEHQRRVAGGGCRHRRLDRRADAEPAQSPADRAPGDRADGEARRIWSTRSRTPARARHGTAYWLLSTGRGNEKREPEGCPFHSGSTSRSLGYPDRLRRSPACAAGAAAAAGGWPASCSGRSSARSAGSAAARPASAAAGGRTAGAQSAPAPPPAGGPSAWSQAGPGPCSAPARCRRSASPPEPGRNRPGRLAALLP